MLKVEGVRVRIRAAVLVVVWVGTLSLGPTVEAYGPAVELFRFKDERITESSGVAASSRQRDVLFTHNDSGDAPRFFAVDRYGCTRTTYSLVGAEAIDWEDMARGPGSAGRASLFFGDIGDNLSQRTDGISVYRVPEPRVDLSRSGPRCARGTTVLVRDWARFDLVYPDAPQDAETLLVHPRTGQLFVVTKTYAMISGVYAAPYPLDPKSTNVLERVATIVFPPSDADPTLNPPFGAIGRVNATGGEIAPAADRVVVRTYTDAWEWMMPDGDIAAAFADSPVRVLLPPTMQGEAIAYAHGGKALVVTTEGVNAPVHLIPG